MKKTSSILIQSLTTSMDLISQTNNPKEIAQIVEKLLQEFSHSDYATLLIFDPNQQTLVDKSNENIYTMVNPEGILGEAFLTKSAAIYNHLASEKNYVQHIDNSKGLRLRSQIVLPIVEKEELLGIVRTSRSTQYKQPYQKMDLELLSSLQIFLTKTIHTLRADKQNNEPVDISALNTTITVAAESHTGKPPTSDAHMLQLSSTVHDIRTPANSLYGFLELMEEHTEDKRLKEFIVHAKESAKFINILTDSILEQAKEKYQRDTAVLEIVKSVKFFSQIANTFSADMSAKNIDYLIYIDPSLPKEIKIDTIKLQRVLINLLGNAYKFTPNGSRIDFKVKYDANEQKIKLSVSDQGIGIDPSRQKDIFKAFEQAEEDTSEHYGGTGLGLSISAKYVNELGGKLKLKSVLEEGSKFHFSVPVKIINTNPSYKKFINLKKKITLLTNYKKHTNPKNIITYLLELGMSEKNIEITDTLPLDTTHLYCFQHKLSPEILKIAKEKNMKVLIVEESLFSLSKDRSLSQYNIISENTYYGDLVHSTAFWENKKKVLIADDNKINITLLRSILETEFVEITTAVDGLEALNILKEAYEDDQPYDAIFIDKHMPSISGSDVMQNYRNFENSKGATVPLFAISITGDPHIGEQEKKLYDLMIKKPFKAVSIRAAIEKVITQHKITPEPKGISGHTT